MSGLLGKKIGMTQVFLEGKVVPATAISAGPCFVVNTRTKEKNGYNAIQLGYGEDKRPGVPKRGYFKKQGLSCKKHLMEFRGEFDYKIGDKIGADIFKENEIVKVSAVSKGKGFQGVV
ncbi:MAG: 50S ribosomal protein L3, partial [bacterium]